MTMPTRCEVIVVSARCPRGSVGGGHRTKVCNNPKRFTSSYQRPWHLSGDASSTFSGALRCHAYFLRSFCARAWRSKWRRVFSHHAGDLHTCLASHVSHVFGRYRCPLRSLWAPAWKDFERHCLSCPRCASSPAQKNIVAVFLHTLGLLTS